MAPADTRIRGITAAALALAFFAPACVQKEGPPRHYKDPQHMIEVFDDPERDAWARPDEVIHALALEDPRAVIADIGAGSGYFSRRLAARVPAGKVYAVDVDDTFRTHIEKHREQWGTPNIEPHLAFYDDPALPAGEVDLVFMSNTYPYISERVRYLEKIATALKPGGALAIISFRPEAVVPGDAAPPREHRVSIEKARAELASAGFTVDREETFLPHQWFLIARRGP